MENSKSLDYFETNNITKVVGIDMERFMKHDFSIDKIVIAYHIEPGQGSAIHKTRESHGLVMILSRDGT